MGTQRAGRRPGRSSSREDIVAAARELFAAQGYERASLRAIAGRAGVDPALIIHYFGSKEGLLHEALTLPVDPGALLSHALEEVPPEQLGAEVVRTVVTAWDDPAVQPLMAGMIRTALSHDLAMRHLRANVMGTVLPAMASLTPGPDATQRAELIASQMVGIFLTRHIVGLPTIAAMSPDDLARTVGPTIQAYLTRR
jgi:AcrR family transcriptional regulator